MRHPQFVPLTANLQEHKLIHEGLERYVVGENGLRVLRPNAAIGTSRVGCRGVQF
ncbi:Sec23/Sec24 trunk domain-containing protein [Colletotrichum asianum]